MCANLSKDKTPSRQEFDPTKPNPGEIWEVSRYLRSPLEFSNVEQQNLYSEPAQRFLAGKSPPRYVMIVAEPKVSVESEEEWQEVSVMVLSGETNFLSNVDLLIPKEISGVGQDLLAETWHVLFMLTRNLLRPVGRRLSRKIYDVLMSVGDYYEDLVDEAPSPQEIQALGLQVGTLFAEQQPEIQEFHQQEEAWSDVLSVPLPSYHRYLKSMRLTDALLNEALQLKRKRKEVGGLNSVSLTNWLQKIDAGWIALSDFLDARALRFASHYTRSDEITQLINQLSSVADEQERQIAAKRLGDIAKGDDSAIQALINLMRTTKDEETLWTAVLSLWRIDPGNPATGVGGVKLIDLGMQVAGETVALAVAKIQKLDRRVGVLLRVYPDRNEPYLPVDLKLILLDNSGQIRREVTARQADNYIQLRFSGQPGEPFRVRVALGEASITEDFII